MCTQILEHDNFSHTVFTDEGKFHISGCVYQHNSIIWSSEPSREHLECEWDTPKVNMCCMLTYERVLAHFSLMRTSLQAIHS
jgi:hypothetical protein